MLYIVKELRRKKNHSLLLFILIDVVLGNAEKFVLSGRFVDRLAFSSSNLVTPAKLFFQASCALFARKAIEGTHSKTLKRDILNRYYLSLEES